MFIRCIEKSNTQKTEFNDAQSETKARRNAEILLTFGNQSGTIGFAVTELGLLLEPAELWLPP